MAFVEYGIVRFFDRSAGKQHGYIQITDADGRATGEKDMFFYFMHGHFATLERGKPEFSPVRVHRERQLRLPRVGDEVVFLRSHNKKGPMASRWAYLEDWEDVQKQAEAAS